MRVEVSVLTLLIVLLASCSALELIDPFDEFIEDIVPRFFNQNPNNENGTDPQFKHYALHDKSNDEIDLATIQHIIARSGFQYETHMVTSADGYITQIINLINPLADPTQLKQPPVMLFHGGTIDPTVFVWASAIQHHPEKYPRTDADGPITSWNRSLAFMLANNGYDVYLVATRGSDSQNQDHAKYRGPMQIDLSGETEDEPKIGANIEATKYWDFSLDEIIKYEISRQIDTVLDISGASNVTLLSYSLSTMTVPPFIALNPDYAAKVHNMIIVAPIINSKGANKFISALYNLVVKVPVKLGTIIVSEMGLTKFLRKFVLAVSKMKYFRYTITKLFYSLFAGPSAKYRSLLELTVLGHLVEPISFKVLKHYFQQMLESRLQMYDYGFVKNELVYGRAKPPEYSISNLNVENWLAISAANDNLATPSSVRQYLQEANPKPYDHIIVKNFNHLDLFTAFENDVHVNFPILDFLDLFELSSPSLSSPWSSLPDLDIAQVELTNVSVLPE